MRSLPAILWDLLLVYLLYMLCRVVYVAEFWDLYAEGWGQLSMGSLLRGSLRFDTSAILYTNAIYVLMLLLPLPRRWNAARGYRLAAKIYYVAVNSLMLATNLFDTVYSRFTGRRTTCSFFAEFSNEGNLADIALPELLRHWYLVLLGLAFIAALIWLSRGTRKVESGKVGPAEGVTHYYLRQSLATLCFVPLAIIGMRGGASTAIRPIANSNANQYVNEPAQANIVLNTPFSLIRTLGKQTFTDPGYFPQEQLDSIYSPLHQPGPDAPQRRKNVVVLIVESFAQEYIGAYNGGEGYTPFTDSLIGQSLTFSQSYANGRKSIDAMPSILSGIPMFVEPFFVSSYSLNKVSSIAGELARVGYTTAFFHGAENGSMGFEAYSRTSGYQRYYGRTEYDADPRFGGEKDFDGTWAIWDEEFMQYFAAMLDTLPQPFATALFTATSHHPFVVPERYRESLHQEGHPMNTCIRYVDRALSHFFATASRMPWYENTLFVITADHTNIVERPEYKTPLGLYRVPIIFFDPSGQMPRGCSPAIAQQTDIMPTLLGYLGYPNAYVAYGIDLLATPAENTWALHYNNGVYQYVTPDTVMLLDESRLVCQDPATDFPKAVIQSYMQRMMGNGLVAL